MGKESTCQYHWANQSGHAKVLLETSDLIIRDLNPAMKKLSRFAIPIKSITRVEVEGDRLCVYAGQDKLTLTLGPNQAKSWATRISSSPPTLSRKLGITSGSHLLLIGDFETPELTQATAAAATAESNHPDLILANITTIADLSHVLDIYHSHPNNPPLWIIYPKGTKTSARLTDAAGETAVRDTLRQQKFIDTKIASVSAQLTALRFIKRA